MNNNSNMVVIDNPKQDGAEGRHCTYSIRNPLRLTEVWYYGATSSLGDRKGQLPSEGKNGLLYVESRWPTKAEAETEETRLIKVFKKRHGRLPRFNHTSDGKFHFRRWY